MFKSHLEMIGRNETPSKKAKFWQSYIRSLKGNTIFTKKKNFFQLLRKKNETKLKSKFLQFIKMDNNFPEETEKKNQKFLQIWVNNLIMISIEISKCSKYFMALKQYCAVYLILICKTFFPPKKKKKIKILLGTVSVEFYFIFFLNLFFVC